MAESNQLDSEIIVQQSQDLAGQNMCFRLKRFQRLTAYADVICLLLTPSLYMASWINGQEYRIISFFSLIESRYELDTEPNYKESRYELDTELQLQLNYTEFQFITRELSTIINLLKLVNIHKLLISISCYALSKYEYWCQMQVMCMCKTICFAILNSK